MMRFHGPATTILAGLIGIPALAVRQQDPLDSLAAALAATENAITELAGLRTGLEARDPNAIDRLVDATEEPVLDSVERARRIEALQRDVDRLSIDLAGSTLGTARRPGGLTPTQLADVANALDSDTPISRPGVAQPAVPTETSSPQIPTSNGVRLEEEGFSVDDLYRARLFVRAGRAHEALELLGRMQTSAEVRYWRARATRETGDDHGALKLFQDLAAEEDAGRFTTWARHDAEVLTLELELRQRNVNKEPRKQ